ncbi:hypothetical protein PRK78_007224 [Emydomyces testavorans]|uniref:Mediator of RNA polymerase II transcription subunit 20 n=1 Tax=Emydomyces testavorans TaxID=2070801 RepID=A0AAF0DRP0_9EURO|nr:hypothetical protein PRK78_007224 [Emydomyces testavorans]
MPVTGVFFIPANPNSATALATVVNQLRTAYDAVPSGRWALEHKLLRDTPSCLPPSSYAPLPQLQPRFMHFLSLSHFQSHGFVYISDRPSPDPWETPQPQPTPASIPTPSAQQQQQPVPASHASADQLVKEEDSQQLPHASSSWTMITPEPASFNSLLAMTLRACEPLWCHRHTMVVAAGTVFEAGDFRIRIGDVRQTQPAQRLRGCLVEIEYRGPGKASTPPANNNNNDDDGSTNWFLPPSESATAMAASLAEDGFSAFPSPAAAAAATAPAADVEEDLLTEEDWEVGEKLIREFWSRFAIAGAREAIRVPGLLTEVQKARAKGTKRVTTVDAGVFNTGIAGADLARQYMELLRFNR